MKCNQLFLSLPEIRQSTCTAPNLFPRLSSVESGSLSEKGGVVWSSLPVAKATTIQKGEDCVDALVDGQKGTQAPGGTSSAALLSASLKQVYC